MEDVTRPAATESPTANLPKAHIKKSASKSTSAAGGGGDAATSGDCRGGHANFPQFTLVVFFEQQASPVAARQQASTPKRKRLRRR